MSKVSKVDETIRHEDEVVSPIPREIHDYFELTYASWLTMPRTLLQSMPEEWQQKFVALLDEFDSEMGWAMDLLPATNVQVLARAPRIVEEEEECENCEGTGDDPEDPEEECPECIGGTITVEGDRYETPEEVGTIPIPIASYQRGRTRVPLASMDPDDVARQHFEMKMEWLKANHLDLWRKHFGPEFEVDEEVEVVRHPDHELPPVLVESGLGWWQGEIVGVVEGSGNSLYKVRVMTTPVTASSSSVKEQVEIQLHADQICKR